MTPSSWTCFRASTSRSWCAPCVCKGVTGSLERKTPSSLSWLAYSEWAPEAQVPLGAAGLVDKEAWGRPEALWAAEVRLRGFLTEGKRSLGDLRWSGHGKNWKARGRGLVEQARRQN